MKSYKNLIINATLLFIITAIVEMTLHECAHFITAFLLHAKDISLHHNYVNYDDKLLSIHDRILIASAGPLFSLLFGIIFNLIILKQNTRNNMFLLNVYCAIHGYIGFFGYLMIAPLSTAGDTGFVFNALEIPFYLVIFIAIIGFISLVFIIKKLTRFIIELGSEEIILDSEKRKNYIASVIKYPVYIGVLIIMLLNLPVPIWLSLLAPFSAFSLFYSYNDALKKQHPNIIYNNNFVELNTIQPFIIIGFIIIVIINRLLVSGIIIH